MFATDVANITRKHQPAVGAATLFLYFDRACSDYYIIGFVDRLRGEVC
jgi:hypothetical protein